MKLAAASFKVISDALEMVEAGVTDRFVTAEKTREQILLITEK